jgi:hypothetical protein
MHYSACFCVNFSQCVFLVLPTLASLQCVAFPILLRTACTMPKRAFYHFSILGHIVERFYAARFFYFVSF